MSEIIRNKENSNKYNWGNGCTAWQLVNTPKFYVVEEIMPNGAFEVEHHHDKARQFFYVLEGIATFKYDGKEFVVKANEGIYIQPGIRHQVFNRSSSDLRMLIISSPPSINDRHE
jgi:mannose-6-phosphate isomerase-like protein (cupin superfamily)